MENEPLIDAIYEAAVNLDSWPTLLTQIAAFSGAKGGLLFASNMDGVRWVASPGTVELYEEFIRQGWLAHNDRTPRLLGRQYPGFLTDSDLYDASELATMPMYTEYLRPLGYDTGAATAIPGLGEDELILSIEGLGTEQHARAIIPKLDVLRPHLARAGMLAARFRIQRAAAAVAALGLIGVPSCLVGTGRRMLAANDMFCARLDAFGRDTPRGLVLTASRADARLQFALTALQSGQGQGMSLPLQAADGQPRAVMHVIPMRGTARDLFSGATAILLLAEPGVVRVPSADIIQALLDLTPAEARLARRLAAGASVTRAAAEAGIAVATARTQLRSIFDKTGLSRQAELISYLGSVARPGA